MKYQLSKLVNPQVLEALGILFKAKLPVKGSKVWEIVNFQKKISEVGKDYDDSRKKLFELYGEKAENDQVVIAPEKQPEFFASLEEILAKEVELPDLKIPKTAIDAIEFSSIDLSALLDLDIFE